MDSFTPVPTALVVAELERIVESKGFRASKSLIEFIKYVVEIALASEGDVFKENVIATAALGKSADFDTRLDPAVRILAGRLRKKLKQYYATEGRLDPVI